MTRIRFDSSFANVRGSFVASILVMILTLGITALTAPHQALSAQAPGYQGEHPRAIRAKYLAEVLERVGEVVEDWRAAWTADDLEEILDSYWPQATLIVPGHDPFQGIEAIRGFAESSMGNFGQFEMFMVDLDANAGMAQVFGNYRIGVQRGARAGSTLSGPSLTVYQQRGRNWKIRSQVFVEVQSDGKPPWGN